MKRRSLFLALMASLVLPALPGFAQNGAQNGALGDLRISGGFLRASPGMSPTGAGFLTIRSIGAADRLLAFSTPACTRPELHTHVDDNGIMRMRKLEAIDVPAGGEVQLKSGGLHLMLIDLVAPLKEGDMVPLTLVFEQAGSVDVILPVKALGAMN